MHSTTSFHWVITSFTLSAIVSPPRMCDQIRRHVQDGLRNPWSVNHRGPANTRSRTARMRQIWAPNATAGPTARVRRGWHAVSGERGGEVGWSFSAAWDQELVPIAEPICSRNRAVIQSHLASRRATPVNFFRPILHITHSAHLCRRVLLRLLYGGSTICECLGCFGLRVVGAVG